MISIVHESRSMYHLDLIPLVAYSVLSLYLIFIVILIIHLYKIWS